METNRPPYFQWWSQLSVPSRMLLVGLIAPILVLNFWAMGMIANFFGVLITIVVVASLLAFLLNYPVSWLSKKGLPRDPVSIIVFLLTLSILLGVGISLFPVAFSQAQQLVARLPELIDSGQQQILLLNEQAESRGFNLNLDMLAEEAFKRIEGQIQSLAKSAVNITVDAVSSLLDIVVTGLVTIIMTYYLLQHGDELWESVLEWLPAEKQDPVANTLRLSFQNYFIGQLIISISMSSALVPLFLVMQVPFGVLFGLTIGTLALIPFGGTVGILLVTLLVALQNFWLGLKVLAAAVIVQQIVDNLLAPRVLGSVVGLNPVWVFISVLIGAKVGGLVGVAIAVPIAAVLKTALMAVQSQILADRERLARMAEVPSEKSVEVVTSNS
ncbi:AI-2E family transporter [Lyngbya confervoides]|uniref:AI-2E family transporter n=1 Tax=Lyngbya confervoides BDU141951 TaxID=1574623 RepID=A0ABD4SZK6_9CYAN|nr:AI-2E family transporter [Lyngbya confervoides]MCM1981856.1 AI-2E family transporter [Lyngbya confervoides BDU141951]